MNTLLLPYFISYYSSAFTINQFPNHDAEVYAPKRLVLYISIWIFHFGPEKLPGLSRNGPQAGRLAEIEPVSGGQQLTCE